MRDIGSLKVEARLRVVFGAERFDPQRPDDDAALWESNGWLNVPITRSTPRVEAWYAKIRERPGFQRWVDLPLT